MKNLKKILIFLSFSLFSFFPLNSQQIGGFGPRIGFSAGTLTQVNLGFHFTIYEILERVNFQPNFEVGIGDNRTTLALGLEFLYMIKRPRFGPYVGGGVGINNYNWEDRMGHGRSKTEASINLLTGIEKKLKRGSKGFFEIKIIVADITLAKFTVGYKF
ncbi:MAG: hypothetical protein ACE5WD_12920 [Candidatus Aminicenantia bacterium]